MKEYITTEDITLSDFTDNVCAQASFFFRILLKEGRIRVDGRRVSGDLPLQKGSAVQYFLTPAQEAKPAFSVLYEDENVTVVDKESGVNSEAVFSALSQRGDFRFLHRLDRNTEGVMIFGREHSAEDILACFRERRAEKIYHAVVLGQMPRRAAVEEAYLKKDEERALVSVSSHPMGEKITTEYEVLGFDGVFSLLKITLHTGKTHQIRAHLAYLGHPVLGDGKYGDRALNKRYHAMRQRLLSKELSLSLDGPLAYLSRERFISPKNLPFPPQNA